MKRFAIYGREFKESYTPAIMKLMEALDSQDAELYVFKPFLDFLKTRLDLSPSIKSYDKATFSDCKADFLLSVGGDGTLLAATTFVKDSGIPIVGINTGRLGFLSSISIDQIQDAIEEIVAGAYMLDERKLLKIETDANIFGDDNFALNEMTIHKKDAQSMIVIHAYVDGKYLNTYWADGLIIATPTGSTAYSLSCGGPIILPSSSNFIITPVAPHNLNVRPVLISDQSTITLKIEGRSEQVLVSLDSRSSSIDQDTVVTVMKNSFTINLLRLKNHSFLKTLRGKLHWGYDRRN